MGVYRGQKVAVKRSKRFVGGVADELLDEAKFVVLVYLFLLKLFNIFAKWMDHIFFQMKRFLKSQG